MPRPASPIFKSLWENFSGVSSELFIVKALASHRSSLLRAEVESQGCVN
jgi:hypothetical protein